jgi:hypothetical protein
MKAVLGGLSFVIVLIVTLAFIIQMPSCQHSISHVKSAVIGLNRTVTLYANDGSVIKTWNGRFQVECNGSTAKFIDEGKAITISGTFLIEEK